MEEGEDYDSDSTVLLADFVNKPQKIDAKRRRLSNLHDKSKAANLHVDENDEPNKVTELSVDRRKDVSPGKNSDSTNWLTSINNYFARMSKNNDANVKENDNRGSIECLSTKSYNSKCNTLDKDNASEIICIDSDDESPTSGKSQDANVNRSSGVNELTSNSEIKVNKPAAISSRRATTNIVQQSKVLSTQRLEEPRIRVLKPSAINDRRSTIHFDQNNLQNQDVNENVTFALNRQINDPNVTVTNPATTSSGRASTNVFEQRVNNPRRNDTQILQENNHFEIRISKPSVTCRATVNLDRKLHRKKVELKSNLERDTATQTDKGNYEKESYTIAEYPSTAAIVNLNNSERRNAATGKNVDVQDENTLTSTSPSNIMLQADKLCTNSEKDINADKRLHDHEETQKLLKRVKINTTEQNSNEPLQESDASNRQNVTSIDHEASSHTVKRYENEGHGTNETAGENIDHGRDVYNFPFERSWNRIRNSLNTNPSRFNVGPPFINRPLNTLPTQTKETMVPVDKKEAIKVQEEKVISVRPDSRIDSKNLSKEITNQPSSENNTSNPQNIQTNKGDCKNVSGNHSEMPSTVADTTINNNERSNDAKSVRDLLPDENTLSSTSLLDSHKNCANIEKIGRVDNNSFSNVLLNATNKSPDKKETCNPRDGQNEVTKSTDKLSKDEHQKSDALGNKVTGITENSRDAVETFAELQTSELQSNLHDRHQDSNVVSKIDGQLESNKLNQNQQKQKDDIENNKSKKMASETTVEHETKNNDIQILGTSDRNQATSEGRSTGLANIQDNQTTRETRDKVHDKQRGATQVSNEQSTAESVNKQEGVERIRSTSGANLMGTNTGVIASSENKKLIIKFHIYFFTQIKEYILKRFPESVIALDEFIQTLDRDARNGIVHTDVQYSCPNPNCKIVSNYSSSLDENKENETNYDKSRKCVFCKGMRKLHTSYLKRSLSKKNPVGDKNLMANRAPAERDNVKEPIEQCRKSQASEIPSGSSGTIRKTVNNPVSTSTVIETGSSISNKEIPVEIAQSSGESKTDNHGISPKQIVDGVASPKLNIPLNPSSSEPVTSEGMQNTETLEQTKSSSSTTTKRANDGLYEAGGELKRMKTNSNNKSLSNEKSDKAVEERKKEKKLNRQEIGRNKSESSRFKYHCLICNITFESEKAGNLHRKQAHTNPEDKHKHIIKKIRDKSTNGRQEKRTDEDKERSALENNSKGRSSKPEDFSDLVGTSETNAQSITTSTASEKGHASFIGGKKFNNNEETIGTGNVEKGVVSHEVEREADTDVENSVKNSNKSRGTSKYVYICDECQTCYYSDYATRVHRKTVHPGKWHKPLFKKIPCYQTHGTEHNIGKSDVLARARSSSSTDVDGGRSEGVIRRSKASLTESKEIQSTSDSAENRTTDNSQRSDTSNDRKKETNIDDSILNIQSNIDRQRKEIISKLFEHIRVTRKRARNKRKNKGRMCIDTDQITVSPDVSKSKDDSTSELSSDVETICHRVKRSRRKITSESDDSNLSTGIKHETSSDSEITPGFTVENELESTNSDSSNNGSKGDGHLSEDDEDHDQRRKGITKVIDRAKRSRRKITSESDDSIENTGDKDVTASDDEITPCDAVEKEDSSNSDSSNIESTYSDESNNESNLSEDEDDGDQRRTDKSKLIDDECRVYNRVSKSNVEAQCENYDVQLSRRRRQRRKLKHRRSKTGGAVTKDNINYKKRDSSIESITGGHTSTASEEGSASDSDCEEDDLSSGVEAGEEYEDTDEKRKEDKTELIDDECRVYNRVSKSNIEAQFENYDVKLSKTPKGKKRRMLQYRSLKKTNGAGTSIKAKRGGSIEKCTKSDDSSYGDSKIRNDGSSDSSHTEENSTASEESSASVRRERNDYDYNSSVGEDVNTASDHETAEESDDSDERSKDGITELIDDECRVYNRVSKSNVEAQCENYDVKLSGKRKTRQTLKQRDSRTEMPRARTKHHKRRKTRNVKVGKCTQNDESSDSDIIITPDKIISTTDIGKINNNSENNNSDLSYDNEATTASENETIKSTKTTLNNKKIRLLNLFGDENARIGRNSDEVRNDQNEFDPNNSANVQNNQESAARNKEAKVLSDDETVRVSEITIKKRKQRIKTLFDDDTEIVGQPERHSNINNTEMILHEDDRIEIDQINRLLAELGPDLQNGDSGSDNCQNVDIGPENHQNFNIGPENHRNDNVRPENQQNVDKGHENHLNVNMGPENRHNDDVRSDSRQNADIGPENHRNDDVGPENHQNVDNGHDDHQNYDVGPDNRQNVSIGPENHRNDDVSSEIRQNVDIDHENHQNVIKGLENNQNDEVGPDSLKNDVSSEKENSDEEAVSGNNASGVNNQSQSTKEQSCLENVQVTNVTSVANKVHIFICQTCSFATDKYDNAIRHCQNKFNHIEDPVTYCEVCQTNFDTTCFERHTVSHTKYLLVVKIKFAHHWLFSNWQAVFENNRILLSEAENMQVQSIYKTYCVKMSVKVDGPWQTALYLCAKCNTYVPHLEIEKHVSQKCTISNFMTHSCVKCNRKFSTSEMLRHHEIYHTGEDNQPFKTIVFNDRHDENFNSKLIKLKRINKEQQRIVDIYRCLCGLCFTSLKNFKFHFLDCESQTNNGAQCPKCTEPRRFPPTDLEDHLSIHRSMLTYEFRTQQVAFQTESNCNIQLSNFETINRIPQNAMKVRPNEELISQYTTIMTEPLVSSRTTGNATELTFNGEHNLFESDNILKDESLSQNTNDQTGEESLDVLKEELDNESTAQQNIVEDFDIINDTIIDEFSLQDMNEDTRLENGDEVEEESGVKNTSQPIQVTPNDEDIRRDMLKDETLSQDINQENSPGNLDNTTTEQVPQIIKTLNNAVQIPCSDDNLIIKKKLLKEESLTQNTCQDNLNIDKSLGIDGTEQNATPIASSDEDLNIKMDMLKFESTNTHQQNLIVESENSQENVQEFLGINITERKTTETTTNDVDFSINTNKEIRERITETLADNRIDQESSQEVMIVEDSVYPIIIDDSDDDDVQVIEVNTDAQRRIGFNRDNDWLYSI